MAVEKGRMLSQWLDGAWEFVSRPATTTSPCSAPADRAHIWPLLEHIVHAGESHPFHRHWNEQQALVCWCVPDNPVDLAFPNNNNSSHRPRHSHDDDPAAAPIGT